MFTTLFGASRELDAFIAAFRIPNLLRDLFAEGAVGRVRLDIRAGSSGEAGPAWGSRIEC
jgi:putative peptidoglycan lipid II flippase